MSEWRGDLADVADICGETVAAELAETLPGIVLYVPKRPREGSPLNRLSDGTRANLVEAFGGDEIYIPSKRPTSAETFSAIEQLIEKGLTVQAVALKLGITEQWVMRCRKQAGAVKIRHRPDPRQMNMFE